jgi:hypothetical protein
MFGGAFSIPDLGTPGRAHPRNKMIHILARILFPLKNLDRPSETS